MKLHLPKLLLTAVLAACVIPQSAEAVVFSRSIESYTGSFSTTADYNSDGITYDAETGALTGVDNSLFSFTLDMDAMTADNANGHVAYVTSNADKWGFNTDSNGTGLTGYWGKWESETSSGNWASSGTAAPADKLNALEKDSNNDIVLSANISNSGTFAYAANGTPIFSMPALQAGGGATITSFIVNNKYISSILTGVEYGHAVTNNDGTFNSSYASVSYDDIPSTQVEATFIGNKEIQINGASKSTNLDNIDNAGDIYVGQSGCLFLQTWAVGSDNDVITNDIEISNNIYIGSTTNGRGALATADYSGDVIIKGAVTLIEDSTYVKESASSSYRDTDTRFEGKLSGDYTLTVKGTTANGGTGHFDDVEFAGEIDLKGLTTVAPIETSKADFTISGKTVIDTLTIGADTKITKSGSNSMEFGNVVLNKKLELADSGTINITGTVSGTNKLEKTGSGTLELSGDNSYSGGTTITGGLVKATHANALGTGSVTVNGGKLEATGQHAIEGKELNISNGTVYIEHDAGESESSAIHKDTAVSIGTGGTLHIKGHDSMGWGQDSSKVAVKLIQLEGTADKKATLKLEEQGEWIGKNSIGYELKMQGYSDVIGIGGNNIINGASVTASNTGNTITFEKLQISKDWNVTVAENGELAISSTSTDEGYTGHIVKKGAGALTLTGTYTNALDLEAGSVSVSGKLTGNVTVTGGELTVSGGDAISGGTLSITNGIVNISANDDSAIGPNTAVSILAGGTLNASGHDMFHYNNNALSSISLKGEKDENEQVKMATLNIDDYQMTNGNREDKSCTMTTLLDMQGYSQVTGNKINTFGSSFTVTNKGNKVNVETIEIRNAWTIDVAAGGELTLASKLETHSDNEGEGKTVSDITKSNAGKLIITGKSSEWSGAMNVTGGTLQLQDDATLGLATVVMSSGTTLETGTGTIAALTLNAGSKLVADTAVSMDGTLTLGGTITLNGGLLTALLSLEAGKTLDLFTNVDSLVLGEDPYTKGTNILDATTAMDLSNWFTLTSPEVVAAISESAPAVGSGYYLGYNAEGTVYVGKVIPEPTTATLSLLALAGLAARRRRK